MSKIWRVEEEQIMKAGKIVGINYTVWYKDENGTRTARREYRHGHYKVIPMTVLNFILDESNEANTKYQEFDGCIYKRTMYQEEKKMENINMTTAQEDIEDAIKFGWIEAQETTNTTDTEEEEEENTVEKIKVVYEKKEGRTYTETWRSENPEEVYERLSHSLIAKKLNNCGWIRSIKRVPLYNGFDRITVTHDNGGRDVYTVASH